MNAMTCPRCSSSKAYFIKEGVLHKHGRENHANTQEEFEYDFCITEYLCKECGLMFQSMEIEAVEEFNRKQNTFIEE